MGIKTLLLVLVGLAFITRIVSEKWRHSQNAKRLGCQPAPMAPSKDPLAIGDILEIIQADKDKLVPELLESRTNIMRKNAGRYVSTFRLKRGLGENLLTFDPENLQAMLAKQFKDFCVGGERLGCMGPLLGKGIVCSNLSSCFCVHVDLAQADNQCAVHQRRRRVVALAHDAPAPVHP